MMASRSGATEMDMLASRAWTAGAAAGDAWPSRSVAQGPATPNQFPVPPEQGVWFHEEPSLTGAMK